MPAVNMIFSSFMNIFLPFKMVDQNSDESFLRSVFIGIAVVTFVAGKDIQVVNEGEVFSGFSLIDQSSEIPSRSINFTIPNYLTLYLVPFMLIKIKVCGLKRNSQ